MLRSLVSRAIPRSATRPVAHASVVPCQVLTAAKHARYNSTKVEEPVTPEIPAAEEPKAEKQRDRRKEWLRRQDDLQRDWDAKELTYEELKPRTEQPTPDKYLIDVREPDEVLQGSIPSAVNLPLSVLANSLHLHHEKFKVRFGWEKPRKDQEIVFYCRSGKRSASACDIAKRNGYTNILNYKGSWLDWTAREGIKSS
ncbi:uncharacterized protein PHACADRAFT_247105 [Phanerochaete carnosa HHB-10118-sp]|uniref:Rhodanese domain-containing protein n=1 Tax=Phanerochaete carnosa (strain HHB-10118-sp) TaxID=650164 RepID=K5XD14_PHACS|nr:uncharacterized protein PHACADRAFT_247105 [Phanerochaete carnosa HHB-10118-sp]EKM60887.1 hypothetical protein PHACADRAFT_247105 [Phanerochaete carnosa HHB-10118-sp]